MLRAMNQSLRVYNVELGETKLRVSGNEEGICVDQDLVTVRQGPRLRSFIGRREDGSEVPIYVEEGEQEHEYTIYLHGEAVRMRLVTERDERIRALKKNTSAATGGAQIVTAPMPGLLKGMLVAEGDVVEKGRSLCILEAMKMENEIKSPGAYVVRRLIAQPGTAVDKGAPLVELGPLPEA